MAVILAATCRVCYNARQRQFNNKHKSGKHMISRRRALQGATALAATVFTPAVVRAQGAPLQLGVLTPLTGAGGFDGPRMLKAMQAVATEVNAAGGLLGRQI